MDQCMKCDVPLDAEEGEICDFCLEHDEFEDFDFDDDWIFEDE